MARQDKDSGIYVRLTPDQIAGLVGGATNGSDANGAQPQPEARGVVTVHETRVADSEAQRLRDEGKKEVVDRIQAGIARILAEKALEERHAAELKAKDQEIARLNRQNRNRQRALRREAQRKAEEAKKAEAAKKTAKKTRRIWPWGKK